MKQRQNSERLSKRFWHRLLEKLARAPGPGETAQVRGFAIAFDLFQDLECHLRVPLRGFCNEGGCGVVGGDLPLYQFPHGIG